MQDSFQVGQAWLTLKTLYGSWLDSVMLDCSSLKTLENGHVNGGGKLLSWDLLRSAISLITIEKGAQNGSFFKLRRGRACSFVIYNFFLVETGPAAVRNHDIILRAVVKMGTWVIFGGWAKWGWVGYALRGLEGEGGGSVMVNWGEHCSTCSIQKQTQERKLRICCPLFFISLASCYPAVVAWR